MDKTASNNSILQPTGELIKSLANNEKFSDVKFLVGPEKKLIHAHKMMLATMSPVFEAMFYADHDLKNDGDQPIEIPDLTPNGFINMLKYIYGHMIESIELSELYDTYMAANKYLVHSLPDNIINYMNSILNRSNCVIIYDQMIEFAKQNPSDLASVKSMIQLNAETTFMSDHFVKIKLDTLISLLSCRYLNIDEIDILKTCYQWVVSECLRNKLESNRSNMQKVFATIKNYIHFSQIEFNQLKGFDRIEDLLTDDELVSLFIHLVDSNKKFLIDCEVSRRNTFWRASSESDYLQCMNFTSQTLKYILTSNQDICIKKIMTNLAIRDYSYHNGRNRLDSAHLEENGQLKNLNACIKESSDGNWCVDLNPVVYIEAGNQYTFHFGPACLLRTSMQIYPNSSRELVTGDESIVIRLQKLEPDSHFFAFIQYIDFFACDRE